MTTKKDQQIHKTTEKITVTIEEPILKKFNSYHEKVNKDIRISKSAIVQLSILEFMNKHPQGVKI